MYFGMAVYANRYEVFGVIVSLVVSNVASLAVDVVNAEPANFDTSAHSALVIIA